MLGNKKYIGVCVVLLAVLLVFCGMGDKNSSGWWKLTNMKKTDSVDKSGFLPSAVGGVMMLQAT